MYNLTNLSVLTSSCGIKIPIMSSLLLLPLAFTLFRVLELVSKLHNCVRLETPLKIRLICVCMTKFLNLTIKLYYCVLRLISYFSVAHLTFFEKAYDNLLWPILMVDSFVILSTAIKAKHLMKPSAQTSGTKQDAAKVAGTVAAGVLLGLPYYDMFSSPIPEKEPCRRFIYHWLTLDPVNGACFTMTGILLWKMKTIANQLDTQFRNGQLSMELEQRTRLTRGRRTLLSLISQLSTEVALSLGTFLLSTISIIIMECKEDACFWQSITLFGFVPVDLVEAISMIFFFRQLVNCPRLPKESSHLRLNEQDIRMGQLKAAWYTRNSSQRTEINTTP